MFNTGKQGLANHPAAHSLTAALKALGTHDTGRLLKAVLGQLDVQLDKLDAARAAVITAGVSDTKAAVASSPQSVPSAMLWPGFFMHM